MKSLTLHVSWNCHLNTCLSTIEQGPADNGAEHKFSLNKTTLYLGHSSSFSRTSICRARIPYPPRGKLKTLQFKPSHRAHRGSEGRPSSLPDNSGHSKNMAMALVIPLTDNKKWDRACAYQPVKNAPEYPSFILGKIPLLWMVSLWSQLFTCLFRSMEL